MFKARRKDTKEIFDILDVWFDPQFNETYFLIWDYHFSQWCWRNSSHFVPPNHIETAS